MGQEDGTSLGIKKKRSRTIEKTWNGLQTME